MNGKSPIGARRWSVMFLAVAGVVAIEIIAQYQNTPGLGVAAAGAIVGLVAGYVGFDSVAKIGETKKEQK